MCIISNASVNSNWSYKSETLISGQNWRFYVTCDLEIWRETLKDIRIPFLCYSKFCASFQSHRWIQTGFTIRERSIWVQNDVFCPMCPCNLMDDLEKIGHLFYAKSSFVHNFVTIIEFQTRVTVWGYPNWGKICFDFVTLTFDLWLWTFCADITSLNGSYSRKFHDDTMIGTLWKRCDGRTDRRAEVFLELLGRS